MKMTKIIGSIGPASSDIKTLTNMVLEGMNVARINFSHANLYATNEIIANLKKVRELTNENIAILYDTKGPELRTLDMYNNEIELVKDNDIKITKRICVGTTYEFSLNHPEVIDILDYNDIIYLENGLIKLQVIKKDPDSVLCHILNSGTLGSRKSVSIPNKKLNIPYLSDNDKKDIAYALSHDIDFLALSFVSSSEDIFEVKKYLQEFHKEDLPLICKIENQLGIDNLHDILNNCDGIMVARGDLGTELPLETLPLIQKDIITKCREQGKIAIVATEMLESMINNPRPTRAEVSDVANAVIDGADAVMLSGETTIGKYPVEAVKQMKDICETTEKNITLTNKFNYLKDYDITETISKSVVESANLINSKLIVANTLSGLTAKKISNLKPHCPILATCTSTQVARNLSLYWGIYPKLVPILSTTDEIITNSLSVAKTFMNLAKKDTIIITGSFPLNSNSTNLMKIEEI